MELTISVDIKGFDQLKKDYPEASERALESRITEACQLLERQVKKRTPQGAGPSHYRDSIFSKVELGQKINYGVSIRGIVSSPFSYGEPLEYGTKPHMPPRREIIWWVAKKLHLSGVELRRAVTAIRWHIYQHGTEGAHMYEKTFEEDKALIISILNKIPDDIVKRLKK